MCRKQYVGPTTDKFRYGWNNYKNCQRRAERGEDHMQKYLHDHFLSEDHDGLLNNVKITLIDKLIHQTLKEEKNFGGLSCVH